MCLCCRESAHPPLSSSIQAPPSGPAPPPPTQAAEEAIVNNLSDKEMKQRLKVIKKCMGHFLVETDTLCSPCQTPSVRLLAKGVHLKALTLQDGGALIW